MWGRSRRLTQSYDVIYHTSFIEQVRKLKEDCPEINDSLVAALTEIETNPIPGTLQGITSQRLRGAIHKKHVGGPGGHRLIYLLPIGSKTVIPVYISPNTKSSIDYNKFDWEEICGRIYTDYSKKNYAAFSNWKK